MRSLPWLAALALQSVCSVSGREAPTIKQGRTFWAFQPIANPSPPSVSKPEWSANPIDAFTLVKLETPAPPEADRRTLIRRLYLDLHGLPPAPVEIDAFLADSSASAYANLVDRLLASRRFAERWARHWLAVARYADSSGGGRAMLLPEAWRYRDYVVDSFDQDRPYSQFVTDQIAGDLLEHTDPKEKRQAITATGFLALGPTNYELQNKELLRMDVIDEQIDTIGRAFMGMTLGCARCHDHFFDPIPTADYYALAGIFRSTKTLEHANVSKWINTTLPAVTEADRTLIQQRREWEDRTSKIRSELATLKNQAEKGAAKPELIGIVVDDNDALFEGSWIVSTAVAGFVGERYLHDEGSTEPKSATYTRNLPESGEYEVRISYPASSNRAPAAQILIDHAGGESIVNVDQRKPPAINGFTPVGRFRFQSDKPARIILTNSKPGHGTVIADSVAFVPLGALEDKHAPKLIPIPEVAALKRKQLEVELKQLEKNRPPKQAYAMSVIDEEKPEDYAINIGGSPMRLGEPVERGYLTVASKPGAARPTISDGRSGRMELARWLTSPEHPLVARVYANRAWHWLTGTGIVPTPDNFGSAGELPTNPALLDHLASRFLSNGGSTKDLVRYIVMSKTYRAVRDSPRRLDAEALRDSMLAVSGELDLSKNSGPSIKKGTKLEFGYRFDSVVRSIYTPVFRNNLPELFDVFDFPDPSMSNGDRSDTTLPTQALFMMNHPWVNERSKLAAQRWTEGDEDLEAKIGRAYIATLARPPLPAELSLATDYLGIEPSLKRWMAFQQTLFASLDFRYY